MLKIGGEEVVAIDADARVIETEQTWSYMEPSQERFRPILVGSEKRPIADHPLLAAFSPADYE